MSKYRVPEIILLDAIQKANLPNHVKTNLAAHLPEGEKSVSAWADWLIQHWKTQSDVYAKHIEQVLAHFGKEVLQLIVEREELEEKIFDEVWKQIDETYDTFVSIADLLGADRFCDFLYKQLTYSKNNTDSAKEQMKKYGSIEDEIWLSQLSYHLDEIRRELQFYC